MKTRVYSLLAACLILILIVGGCGRSQRTVERQSQWQGETPSQPAKRYRTERFLHPMTGRIETLRIPVDDDRRPDADADSPDPKPAADPKPDPKPEPEKHTFSLQWQADCPVERAYDAASEVLLDLGLAEEQYQTRRMRNPQTGRIETRRISVSGGLGHSDGLSAILEGRTTAGIDFDVSILLAPPESSLLTITANSTSRPEDILEPQVLFLKDRISDAIAAEPPESDSLPYPPTLMLDRPVNEVADTLYRWAEEQGFERNTSGRDQYYRMVSARTGSGIDFEFTLRLVEPERTILDMDISGYEDKPEFELMLRRLMETLDMLQGDRGQRTDVEPAPYPETLMLQQTPENVAQLISKWAQDANFERNNSEGDDFYRYLRYETGSGIRLYFYMRLVEPDTTKLNIRVTNFENKEEFGMILQSLETMLDQMQPASAGETAG